MSAAHVLHDDLGLAMPVRRPAERHLRLVSPDETVRPTPPSARLRITRRGRLAITGAVTALLVVTAGGLAGAVMPPSEAATVTVEPGQTLSEIAATTLPDLPLDRAVVELQVANQLSSVHVQAGQTLVIPSP
jgi:LysM repeat protein